MSKHVKLADLPTWEEVKARLAAESRLTRAKKWPRRFWRSEISWRLRRELKGQGTKWRIQRLRQGWSDRDVWNADGHILSVTAGMLERLAGGHAYPGEGTPYDTPEKWETHLHELATRLRTWNKDNDSFLDMEAYETSRAALREVADELGMFWD